jgi:glycosyltransferase involved in cell wall biosynthesis
MRALYLSAFIPSEHGGHAGAQVSFSNLKRLYDQGYDVTPIICTTELSTPPLPGVTIFRQSILDALIGSIFYAFLKPSMALSIPFIGTRLNICLFRYFRCMSKAVEPFDLVYLDFTQSIFASRFYSIPVHDATVWVACVHDIYSQKIYRESWSLRSLLYWHLVRCESDLLRSLDKIFCLCDKDMHIVRDFLCVSNSLVLPYQPPSWVSRAAASRTVSDTPSVLFFANFDRRENRASLEWFLNSCYPAILSVFPQCELRLLGQGSDRLNALLPQAGNIQSYGYMSDPSPVFSSSCISIAPIVEGAGVKYKVLDSLAAGIPVVSTPIGAEGVPKDPMLTVARPEKFAEALISSLANVIGQ